MPKPILILICIALVVLALVGAVVFVKTAPEAERKRPPKTAIPVETQPLEMVDETVVLHLAGTVVPAQEIALGAQVGGKVVELSPNFIEGGMLKRGEIAVRIEPVDYELALADAESRLQQARTAYTQELGRRDVALREWDLLKTSDATEQEKELALRMPQLASAEATLKAAESALEKAKLDLERTNVESPFNAVVLQRSVDLGSIASGQLATLAGTDAYWVQVSIPVDRIDWVEIPGSSVEIVSSSGAMHEGRVIQLLGDLEPRGRMARLLVEVKDPLGLAPERSGKKPLLLGEYVKAEVSGRTLSGVFSIPRNALHEGNVVWIAQEGQLAEKPVEVLWRDAEQVLIRNGLQNGDLLIVSDLATPVPGMDVNTGSENKEKVEG